MKQAGTTLLISVAGLLALGLVMLYSSSMADRGARLLLLQLAWAGLGILGCIVAAAVDYQRLKKWSWVLLVVAVVMLALVLVPHIGRKIGGARRWFDFGPANFQPSEFAKIALIFAVAAYCDWQRRHMDTFVRGLVWPSALIGVVLALIFVEPDRGTTILLGGVTASMLLVAGIKLRYVVLPIAAGAAVVVWSILHDPLRMARVESWLKLIRLDPDVRITDADWQVWQGILAFGAGGTGGVGLGEGRQKLGFLPEHHTDFILPVVGEELGIVASLFVVVAFLALFWSGITIAWRARDMFGRLVACGITFLIAYQAFINIAVVTSILPNKGLPLPFISYGGSNLLMTLTAVGLLLSVARHSDDSVLAPHPSPARTRPLPMR
jgi:cell division protein FtsW